MAFSISISNGSGSGGTQLLLNPGFESGAVSWSGGSGIINNTTETTTTSVYDTLKVQVRTSGGTILATLATYSNLNKGTSYAQKSVDLTAYKGQTVQVFFVGTEDASLQTTFLVDDVALTVP